MGAKVNEEFVDDVCRGDRCTNVDSRSCDLRQQSDDGENDAETGAFMPAPRKLPRRAG